MTYHVDELHIFPQTCFYFVHPCQYPIPLKTLKTVMASCTFLFDFSDLYLIFIGFIIQTFWYVSQRLFTKRRIKYLLQEQEGQEDPPGPSLLLPPPTSQQAVHQHNSIGTSRGDWRRGGRGGFRARGSSSSHRNRHGRRHHQAAATSRWRWLKLRPMSNYCSIAVVRKKWPGAGILSLVLGVDWVAGQAIH